MDAAVFLDRDNTIIHNDGDLGDPAEVRLIQGAANAIASLCGLGYKIVVITNQGGVARGKYGEQDVHAVHERIRELVAKQTSGARIDAFYYCPYHPKGEVEKYTREHPDRKPQPGMLLRAAKDLNLDLSRSWMVGDAVRDVQAGAAAGTRSLLVRPDLDQLSQQQIRDLHNEAREVAPDLGRPIPDGIVHNLIEAVRIIAQRKSDRPEKHPPRTRWEVSDVARLQQDTGVDAASKPKPAGDPPPQAASSSATTPDRPPRKQRPFRPLDAPPLPERDEKPGPAVAAAPPKQPQPAPAKTQPERKTDDPRHRTPPQPEVKSPAPKPQPTERPAPGSPAAEQTLRLILQELRSQRGDNQEFSYARLLAIVLQLIAGVCLLGALWMGAGDGDLFARWMGAGLLFQGATIAALLFDR